MAKRVFAVTDIDHNGERVKAGDPLDPTKFTKDQLRSLYEAGAVEIVDSTEKAEDEKPQEVLDAELALEAAKKRAEDEEAARQAREEEEEKAEKAIDNELSGVTAPVEEDDGDEIDIPAKTPVKTTTPPAKVAPTKATPKTPS